MYSPVRKSTEAPYLLVDLAFYLPVPLSSSLSLFNPTLRKLRRREVREGAAHKLKPHCLYDPFVISSPELRPIRKLQNSGPPTGLGVAENPLELNGF